MLITDHVLEDENCQNSLFTQLRTVQLGQKGLGKQFEICRFNFALVNIIFYEIKTKQIPLF